MSLATDAERFRTMSDTEYSDLQNGRTTVAAILATPGRPRDYADQIAERIVKSQDRKLMTPRAHLPELLAQAAREGYKLAYGQR